ncbi:N-acetyltransferase [Cyanobium sp. Morenito 9A2]|uniref:N-acetyltransferase n=1 Tax=Cyanobium sp. Morenito 9A2 TaxID=2823718 RepID=UPI0020CBE86F|nr:N-acetyltransferase [Cyanobium sp. Morenito 9A2]MCP9850602.1 N-acetyltransferase [Cyanobium sp. Morenito 9A2]
MIPFRSSPSQPRLPEGYRLETSPAPRPHELDALLVSCGDRSRTPELIERVLARSIWHLLVRNPEGQLVGFVRATSDLALNANLWDLSAAPSEPARASVLEALVHGALQRLRREMAGCSISLSAPPEALEALRRHGFIVDPGGIRAMGLTLARPVESVD